MIRDSCTFRSVLVLCRVLFYFSSLSVMHLEAESSFKKTRCFVLIVTKT